jgi:hypothetical protein
VFSVVEWFSEPGQARPYHTCLRHTRSRIVAESEAEVEARPTPPFLEIDKEYTYTVVEFEDDTACPLCGRDYEF